MPTTSYGAKQRAMMVATAITAAGIWTAPAPAGAIPPVPLAPPCTAWTYTGPLSINQDNGIRVDIDNWMGISAGTAENQAQLFQPDGKPGGSPGGSGLTGAFGVTQDGTVSGGISGRNIDFTIAWNYPEGLTNHYTGSFDQNGNGKGTTLNSKGVTNGWSFNKHFDCSATESPPAAPDAAAAAAAPAANPPPPPPPPVAPSNAVQVNINRAGVNVNVNVTNTAALAGQCTYVANPTNDPLLPTVNKNFSIAANGSQTLTFLAPPPLSTYHVVVSCHGTFNGQNVEFGHVEQDVSG